MDHSPLHLLHRAWQCAGEAFQQEMAEGDLTPRQFVILTTVNENEGLSQVDLVARTGIDRSTVTDLVQRMTKKGLLRRRRARNDARAYSLRLTEEGRRALRLAAPRVERVDYRLLAALPPQNRERFLADLKYITKFLNAGFEPEHCNGSHHMASVKTKPLQGHRNGGVADAAPRLSRQLATRITP